MRDYDHVLTELEREAVAIGRRIRRRPPGPAHPGDLEELRRLRSRMMLPLLLASIGAIWTPLARLARRAHLPGRSDAGSSDPRRLA